MESGCAGLVMVMLRERGREGPVVCTMPTDHMTGQSP